MARHRISCLLIVLLFKFLGSLSADVTEMSAPNLTDTYVPGLTDTSVSARTDTPVPGLVDAPVTSLVDTHVSKTTGIPVLVLKDEQKQRLYLSFIIINELASDSCQKVVISQIGDQTLSEFCSILELVKGVIGEIDCTQTNYDQLHGGVCQYNASTPLSNDIQRQREYVKFAINNQVTSQSCKSEMLFQMSNVNQNTNQSCQSLEKIKSRLVSAGCSETDYNKLLKVICENGVPTGKPLLTMQQYLTFQAENTLSSELCTALVLSQTTEDGQVVANSCQALEKFETAMPSVECSDTDYNKIHSFVCAQNVVNDLTTSGNSPGNTKEYRLQSAISRLSDRCQRTMLMGLTELAQPADIACKTLNRTMSTLLGGKVCIESDFIKLRMVVCDHTDNNNIDLTDEDQKKANALSVIETDLTQKCQNFFWPKAGYLISDLAHSCSFLQKIIPILKESQYCTEDDFDSLQDVICVSQEITGDEKKKAAINTFKNTLVFEVGGDCRIALLSQIEKEKNNTLPKICGKLQSGRILYVPSGLCSEADYTKLENIMCGEATVVVASLLLMVMSVAFYFMF